MLSKLRQIVDLTFQMAAISETNIQMSLAAFTKLKQSVTYQAAIKLAPQFQKQLAKALHVPCVNNPQKNLCKTIQDNQTRALIYRNIKNLILADSVLVQWSKNFGTFHSICVWHGGFSNTHHLHTHAASATAFGFIHRKIQTIIESICEELPETRRVQTPLVYFCLKLLTQWSSPQISQRLCKNFRSISAAKSNISRRITDTQALSAMCSTIDSKIQANEWLRDHCPFLKHTPNFTVHASLLDPPVNIDPPHAPAPLPNEIPLPEWQSVDLEFPLQNSSEPTDSSALPLPASPTLAELWPDLAKGLDG